MDNLNYLVALKERLMNYKFEASESFIDFAFGDTVHHSSSTQQQAIMRLSDVFVRVQNTSRREIEHEFLSSYWEFAKQPRAIDLGTSLACYSASTAIEIIANYLKRFNLRTALIEPTFDNLPSILHRVGVELVSFSENDIFPSLNYDRLLSLGIDAVFVVLPNNPTGQSLNKEAFNSLVNFCAEHKKLLIVDFCFRFFSKTMEWDQYGMALDAKCKFLFIEDTGKTWPLLDLKTALLTTHPIIYKEIKRIHNEFLLNVSPFILELIHQYIVSVQSGGEFDVVNTVQENRKYLRERLKDTILQPVNLHSRISFEWLQILDKHDDIAVWEILRAAGIYTLPGSLFYWNMPSNGAKKLRIALMREAESFKSGVDKLAETISIFNSI